MKEYEVSILSKSSDVELHKAFLQTAAKSDIETVYAKIKDLNVKARAAYMKAQDCLSDEHDCRFGFESAFDIFFHAILAAQEEQSKTYVKIAEMYIFRLAEMREVVTTERGE